MNEQEIKKFYRNTFNTVADGYDSPALRFFPESAARIPAYLRLQGHEHVLDVATGTGAAAMALAAFLKNGRVTGIDFSEKMLARAGRKVAEKGFDNVSLHEMDMQKIAFPERHFDAATCCFALFFLQDMQEQLRHIASKVKETGKVVITSFYENSFSPPVDVFFSCLKRYGIEPPIMSWKRVATKEKCSALFEGAGMKNVFVELIDSGYSLNSPDEWWQIVWNGGFRGLVEKLEEKDLARFKKELLVEISELANDSGIRMEMGIIYTVGTV
jgi:ubiquinone/menaquinone biosynthesis C-methylase UbiE